MDTGVQLLQLEMIHGDRCGSDANVERTVRNLTLALDHCCHEVPGARDREGTLGTLTGRFAIAPDGSVPAVTISGDLASSFLGKCLNDRLRALRFESRPSLVSVRALFEVRVSLVEEIWIVE